METDLSITYESLKASQICTEARGLREMHKIGQATTAGAFLKLLEGVTRGDGSLVHSPAKPLSALGGTAVCE